MFLDLGSTPPANTLPTSLTAQETFYPLQLGVCTVCWLVQQMEIVPDDTLYGVDYAFYSGASLPKQTYHRELSRRLLRDYPDQSGVFTVEIACNDGDLLRHFNDVGCPVLGVDPAAGPLKKAAERGLPVAQLFFGRDAAEEIRSDRGQAGLIIANHVAAHVTDLGDFFGGIDLLLANDGVAVIEVQYLMDLLVGNQIDHVYHEHRYHFSLTSLENIAAQHNLFIKDVQHTPAQSGSISVTLTRRPSEATVTAQIHSTEYWLRDSSAYQSLQGRADRIRYQLNTLLAAEEVAGRRVAGYAAPAKATTLLNYCGIGPTQLGYIVDTTPFKVGKFIPGTQIPIVGRRWSGVVSELYEMTRPVGHELPDTWLLLAWNYLPDVLRREYEFTGDGGRWIVPIPVPTLL